MIKVELPIVFLASSPDQVDVKDRILDILKQFYSGKYGENLKCLNVHQVLFLVRATGDWHSNDYDMLDALGYLETAGKIRYANYMYSFVESHENLNSK